MLRSTTPAGRAETLAAAMLGRGALSEFDNATSWGQAAGAYSAGPEEIALQPGRLTRVPLTFSLSNGAILHSWVSVWS